MFDNNDNKDNNDNNDNKDNNDNQNNELNLIKKNYFNYFNNNNINNSILLNNYNLIYKNINFSNNLKKKLIVNYNKDRNLNICIVLHFFHFELFAEFCIYLKNIIDHFQKTVIIISLPKINKESDFYKFKFKKVFNKNIIYFIDNINFGTDINPFLLSLKLIKDKKINVNYILKIHTKVSNPDWRKGLIINITKKEFLNDLEIVFKSKNIGFIASDYRIVENDNNVYIDTNYLGLKYFSKIFNIKDGENFKNFVGGTMFWINYDCVKFIDDKIINYLQKGFSYGKPEPNHISKKIHNEYIAERLLTGTFTKNNINITINNYGYFDIV